jgi:hypothetical protein
MPTNVPSPGLKAANCDVSTVPKTGTVAEMDMLSVIESAQAAVELARTIKTNATMSAYLVVFTVPLPQRLFQSSKVSIPEEACKINDST